MKVQVKIEILGKNCDFRKNFKFRPKLRFATKNLNLGPKLRFWSKIEILGKN